MRLPTRPRYPPRSTSWPAGATTRALRMQSRCHWEQDTSITICINWLWISIASGYGGHEGVLPGIPAVEGATICLGRDSLEAYPIALIPWSAMTPTPSRRRGVCALAIVLLTTAGCSTGTASPALSHGLPAPIREVLPNGMPLIIQEHRAPTTIAIHLWTRLASPHEPVAA